MKCSACRRDRSMAVNVMCSYKENW